MQFKICAIGCGEHAFNFHGPSLRKYAQLNKDALLAACCDKNEERARSFRAKFGFQRLYTDISEMLEKEKPDAVCLVVPVEHTARLAADILECGFPLILEKPPGRTKEETAGLIEIAQRKDIPNRVAFNRRYAPLVRELKKQIEGNFKPEDIHSISCEMLRSGRTDCDFSTTAIHIIDAVRFIAASDYKTVRFSYQELPLTGPGVTNIMMDCAMLSGARVHINICPVSGVTVERMTVNLLDHTFFLHAPMSSKNDRQGSLVHLHGNTVELEVAGEELPFESEPFEYMGFYYENASFFDSLRAGRKPDGDLASALQSVEVAQCIRNRVPEYYMIGTP